MTGIVITGLGAVTPLGPDVASTWDALLRGTSGATALTQDWATDLPSRVVAPVTLDPLTRLERVQARKMDRCTQLGVIAAQEAWHDAGLGAAGPGEGDVDPERLGVSVGTGFGGLHTLFEARDAQLERGSRRVSPTTVTRLMPNATAAQIGLAVGARSGVHCPVAACASGAESLWQAADQIRLGRADVMLAGGTESVIHALPLAAFGVMQSLTRRNDDPTAASRPWDKGRDGFVMAEGAAVLVLESEEHARARGARVYARLAGAGVSNDSYGMVQPEPSGAGQQLAIRRSLHEAGIDGAAICHVNAHATSTPQGDVTEARSCREALGASSTAVYTATKSMTGHMLGAAGAAEAVFTTLALHHRVVPPTINLDDPEDGLGIDVATTPRTLPAGPLAALSTSFGFGGSNTALVLTRD